PWPEAPRTHRRRDNVISFPGAGAEAPEEDGLPDEEPPGGDPLPPEDEPGGAPAEDGPGEEGPGATQAGGGPEEGPDNLVASPRRRSPLSRFLNKLDRRMDRYADQMYTEEGVEVSDATRRAEELIPGVDREEAPREPGPRVRRRTPPPPPDTAPQ